jgi:two-component system, NarL family, response regulator DevR
VEDDPRGDRQPAGRRDEGSAVSVFVLDDHYYVRAMLVELIDAAEGMRVVGSSGSVPEAISEIARLSPRVAVVDSGTGDRDGLEVCRELQATFPDVSCIIVTSAVGMSWGRNEAASAGAAAYVIKEIRDFGLVEAIVRVAAGHRPIDDHQPGEEALSSSPSNEMQS